MDLHAATHIRSHNITTAQDIAATDALASESEANGEPFPIHKLPTPPAVKKEAVGDAALMRLTFTALSYGPDMRPYNRIKQTIAQWIATNCHNHNNRQMYARITLAEDRIAFHTRHTMSRWRYQDTVEIHAFRARTRSLDQNCPDFGRKAITSQVGHGPYRTVEMHAFRARTRSLDPEVPRLR